MDFYSAPEDEWVLSDALRYDGRAYLWNSQTFEQITEQLFSEAVIVKIGSEFLKSNETLYRQYKRSKIILSFKKATVDLFHNSRSGYRAQYYCSVENGERANRYLLNKLLPLILGQKNDDWLKASLLHEDAKTWIHQGKWLRPSKGMKIHRNLNVARWCQETEKWAHWSKLTPIEERIEIKGAYLDKAGDKASEDLLNSCRAKRSEKLYKYGYT